MQFRCDYSSIHETKHILSTNPMLIIIHCRVYTYQSWTIFCISDFNFEMDNCAKQAKGVKLLVQNFTTRWRMLSSQLDLFIF